MATPIPANRASFTTSEVALVTRGALVLEGAPERGRAHVGITTDTRAVVPGGIFLALRGERHDGHDYLAAAIGRGATLLVVARAKQVASLALASSRVDVVAVDETLVAWGDLAKAHLASWRRGSAARRVVAITGSSGKTTTKELVAALLSQRGVVRATDGNLNNRIGVPAMCFTLDERHRFAVLECGMSVRGEMAELARIVSPDVAAITMIGLAHAENVGGTREGVAKEKAALFAGVVTSGTLIVNADDPLAFASATTAAESPAAPRRVTFGRTERADIRLVSREPLGFEGSRLNLQRGDQPAFEVVLPIVGEGAAMDFACAIGCADAAGERPLDAHEVAIAAGNVRPSEGRADVRRRSDGAIVVDDTYNANPQSMQNALQSLSELAKVESRRAICVLGEMKELGPLAERAHDELGDAVASAGVALFVGCGGLVDRALARAAAQGVRTLGAKDADEAAAIAAREVGSSDLVLVKGSRSVGTERVVAALLLPTSGGAPQRSEA